MRVNVIGIGWYRQEHYDQLKEMFKDGDKLPDTYAQWLALAQNVCDKLTADGFEVVRAEISPDTFPEVVPYARDGDGRQGSCRVREPVRPEG